MSNAAAIAVHWTDNNKTHKSRLRYEICMICMKFHQKTPTPKFWTFEVSRFFKNL